MSGTYQDTCHNCGEDNAEFDELAGSNKCINCNDGIFFCGCNAEITEHQLDTVGACNDCR